MLAVFTIKGLKRKTGCGANVVDLQLESAGSGVSIKLVHGTAENAEDQGESAQPGDSELVKHHEYNHMIINDWNVHVHDKIQGDALEQF